PDVERATALGYRWLPLPLTRQMDIASDIRGAVALAALLAREQFDIVHTHNIKVGLIARVLAGLLRAPIVVHTVHGTQWSRQSPQPKRAVNVMFERIAALAADLLLVQSETDRDTLVTSRVAPRRESGSSATASISRASTRGVSAPKPAVACAPVWASPTMSA